MIKSKRLVSTPYALFCKLCGRYIDPFKKFVRCRETASVYCSWRCFYYDVLQSQKKKSPGYAQLNNILEQHCSNIEQKMNLLVAVSEITNFWLRVYRVYWFYPEIYRLYKWQIYQMFKEYNATPVDLDRLAADLYSMRYIGVSG